MHGASPGQCNWDKPSLLHGASPGQCNSWKRGWRYFGVIWGGMVQGDQTTTTLDPWPTDPSTRAGMKYPGWDEHPIQSCPDSICLATLHCLSLSLALSLSLYIYIYIVIYIYVYTHISIWMPILHPILDNIPQRFLSVCLACDSLGTSKHQSIKLLPPAPVVFFCQAWLQAWF